MLLCTCSHAHHGLLPIAFAALCLQVKAPSQPPGEGGPAAGGAAPPPPPGHPAPGSSQPLDLELERKLMAELKAGASSSVDGGAGSSGAGAVQVGKKGFGQLGVVWVGASVL